MPRKDGTGPTGTGPLTGRGFGPCSRGSGTGTSGSRGGFAGGFGRRFGRGRGLGANNTNR